MWCDTLIHWDLCSNPVDLEQREGRIQRYGGLSIRRAIADRFGRKALKDTQFGESPWDTLASFAEQARPRDPSGLSPWWIFQGAQIHRYVFDVPLSAQDQQLSWLQKQRLLYRLVLGQPNQEDLVEYLANNERIDANIIQMGNPLVKERLFQTISSLIGIAFSLSSQAIGFTLTRTTNGSSTSWKRGVSS